MSPFRSTRSFICAFLGPIAIVAAVPALAAGDLAGPDLPPAGATVLELKAGNIDTRTLPNLLSGDSISTDLHFVLQLDGPNSLERAAALAAAGVTVDDCLPQNAFVVRLRDSDLSALRALSFVIWLGDFRPEWKLAPDLGGREFQTDERNAIYTAGQVRVAISLFPGDVSDGILAELARVNATVSSADRAGDQWIIDATMQYLDAVALANLPAVQFVEDAPEITFRNDSNRWILQSNVSGQTPVWDHGIHGEGQIGGLIDGAMRESHCMFDDTVAPGPAHRKIIGYRGSTGSDTHGTHTAGTFVGDATPWGAYTTNDGMAFAAKVSFKNLSSVGSANLYSSLQEADTDGARVHSNSWGDDSTTAYTTHCRQIDQFSWDYQDNCVAFAVTNTSTLKTPENSTNVLAVAASMDTPNQTSFCSGGTGLTSDGRRKPEVYAPGCNTQSAWASTTCSSTGMTGTSMASPAAAGCGLLVRQYYTDGFYPSGAASAADSFVPTGGLIRATLMSAAVDMTGIAGYPSNLEGWGRLLLDGTLYFSGDARKLIAHDVRRADGLSTGQIATYTVVVVSSAEPLRVTLTYTQPPAAVNTTNPAINNLDLEVQGPAAELYRGNVFTSGQSTTGGTSDTHNNTEMVIRTAPTPGLYTITVRATAVNTGPSPYALVVTGNVTEQCPDADINGDCHVDLADLALLLSAFGTCTGDAGFNAAADFDASGCIELSDLSALLAQFGM
ncbi:MAG: S8 family serine peptidase [Planctomycetes bacterium]|nr:S8 family serine peptidase [Planctomycetota bacterium]